MAQRATAAGASVVAILSLRHAHRSMSDGDGDDWPTSPTSSSTTEEPRATPASPSRGWRRPVAPTSTVAGAAIVNAIVAESVEILTPRGVSVDIFASSNLVGGIAANSELAARYRERVRAL